MTITEFNKKYCNVNGIKYGIEYRYCEKTGIKKHLILLHTTPKSEGNTIYDDVIFNLVEKWFKFNDNYYIKQEIIKDFMLVIETEVQNGNS